MRELKSSIAFSFFTNGYVRHDANLAHHIGVNFVGANDILTRPRLPYNASSRHLLTALELGLLPVNDELPPNTNLTYYDGCLIAEVFDYRGVRDESIIKRGSTWRKSGRFSRILLRPDTCSHIADCDLLTSSFGDREALKFESRLLLAQHPVLDLGPTPKQYSRRIEMGNPPIRKKRRRERNGDVYPRPPVSMTALMLIDASAKEQLRVSLKSKAHKDKPPTPSPAVAALPEHLRGCGEQTAVMAKKAVTYAQNSFKESRPPQELFMKLWNDMPIKSQPVPEGGRPTKAHERLRTIRMLLPDRNSAQIIRQAKNSHASGMSPNEQIAVLQKTQKTLAGLNRAGRPVCVLELVSRPGKGCDVALFRGIIGDKARDVNKIGLSTAEEANAFLDQFKRILERENYICIHDGDPHKVQSQQAIQQGMEARRRAQAAQAAAAGAAGSINAQVPSGMNPNLFAARAQQAQQHQVAMRRAVAMKQQQHAVAMKQQHQAAAQRQQQHMQQVAAATRGGRLSPAAASASLSHGNQQLMMSPNELMRVRQDHARLMQAQSSARRAVALVAQAAAAQNNNGNVNSSVNNNVMPNGNNGSDAIPVNAIAAATGAPNNIAAPAPIPVPIPLRGAAIQQQHQQVVNNAIPPNLLKRDNKNINAAAKATQGMQAAAVPPPTTPANIENNNDTNSRGSASRGSKKR